MSLFNQAIFKFFFYKIPHVTALNVLGIFLAEYLPYLLAIIFLLLAYYQKGWRCKIYLFCEGALAVILSRGLITEFIRLFYHHQRPFSFYGFTPLIQGVGWSFPSGHAAFFFALAMTVWYINKKWGTAYFILATAVCLARIYVGIHWPFDIAAGAAIGTASSILIHWLLKSEREALAD